MLSLPLTCDGLRTANRLIAPAGTIERALPIWLNSAAGNLTVATERMVELPTSIRSATEISGCPSKRQVIGPIRQMAPTDTHQMRNY